MKFGKFYMICYKVYNYKLGLKKLHSLSIAHRDLKCANIFQTEHFHKIGDMNVSKCNKNDMLKT